MNFNISASFLLDITNTALRLQEYKQMLEMYKERIAYLSGIYSKQSRLTISRVDYQFYTTY